MLYFDYIYKIIIHINIHMDLLKISSLSKLFVLFSPFLQIILGALIAHYFFLKQFLTQKKQERDLQITNQRDLFNKEIFDEIMTSIENAYQALSDVKKYCSLFKNQSSKDFSLFKFFLHSFREKYLDLHDKINLVLLKYEKYDFIIDPLQEKFNRILVFQSEFLKICLQTEKLGTILLQNDKDKDISKENWDEFSLAIDDLSKVCSKINLHLQKLTAAPKMLIKNIFNSLNAQIQ